MMGPGASEAYRRFQATNDGIFKTTFPPSNDSEREHNHRR